MEVRIKDNNGYVDAEWTIEDGIMVVSPKEVKFEPKDGDVVVCRNGEYIQIFICKNFVHKGHCYCHCFYDEEENSIDTNNKLGYNVERYATKEEEQKLFDRLAEEGWEWDSEKKELVEIKWKPKEGEIFHFPIFSDVLGEFVTDYQENDGTIFMSIERNWCFKTEAECQAFCDKLNQAISEVKP